MKRQHAHQDVTNEATRRALKRTCLAACRKVLERIAGAREMIFREWQGVLRVPEQLVRLALNEAEAVAWQTTYPDLVFPVLANEKVRAVVAWDAKQQTVRRGRHALVNPRHAQNRNHQLGRARL